MQYRWVFDDGTESTNRNVIHHYNKAGTYQVKLLVNSSSICADSFSLVLHVAQNAIANFSVNPVCTDLPSKVINNTADTTGSPVHYSWDFGNGQISTAAIPPELIYHQPGIYPVKLSVFTPQCPTPLNTLIRYVVVDKPKPGITYPVEYGVINLPLPLHARNFGNEILWTPAVNLDNPVQVNPVFKGSTEQLYLVAITEANGCLTVDTQQVKLVKNVEIWVPNAFTPNADGKNDLLRPLLRGIKSVNYFRIYNRWGELIFEMKNDRPGWDGTYKGLPQPAQALVWTIEAIGADNNIYRDKGTSILVR
jgi:gliding motility-associated-like protein